MRKILQLLAFALFLGMILPEITQAQSIKHPVAAGKFGVRFVIKNVDCSVSPKTLTVALQVKANAVADTFLMGDANYRFVFKTAQLNLLGTAPNYSGSLASQENFSSLSPANDLNYGVQNLNGSNQGATTGIVSLNTFYTGSNQGAKLVGTNWMTVGCVKFQVLNGNDCFDLVWNDGVTFPITGMSEVYNIKTSPSFDYKLSDVPPSGYFGNVNDCMLNLCSPLLVQDDVNATAMNTPVSGQVLTNDLGVGLIVSTTPTVNVSHGSVILKPDGTYTYTPAIGYVGTDSFTYQVCDGSTPQKCNTANVIIQTITINCTPK
ncbi:MAG: Ig-like domain-containing protein [Arcicella sp.]|nr:Ig-like domain-containing protein [Arcicella sp.]